MQLGQLGQRDQVSFGDSGKCQQPDTLGRGGGVMTQATRRLGPINILGPGASQALSQG